MCSADNEKLNLVLVDNILFRGIKPIKYPILNSARYFHDTSIEYVFLVDQFEAKICRWLGF